MDGNKTVTATFTQDTYTLNVTVVGSGSVTKNPNQVSYLSGTSVQLTSTLTLAARLCGATLPHIDTPGFFVWFDTKKLYDGAISQTHSLMDEDSWVNGYLEGQSLSLDQAISLGIQALKESFMINGVPTSDAGSQVGILIDGDSVLLAECRETRQIFSTSHRFSTKRRSFQSGYTVNCFASDLWPTAVAQLFSNGISVFIVSKIIGHSKPSITSDIYGHLVSGSMDGIGEQMDELIAPISVNVL